MEGTFSVGVYDAAGKLLRALHTDDEAVKFGVALNGLITYWNGKDDSGAQMPAGKYSARGWCVGEDTDVEGEAFLCNDFVVGENTPRVRRIIEIKAASGGFEAIAETAADGRTMLKGDATGKLEFGKSAAESTVRDAVNVNPEKMMATGAELENAGPASAAKHREALVQDGKIIERDSHRAPRDLPLDVPSLTKAIDACFGERGNLWVIDQTAAGAIEVKEFSPRGEFLRRLATEPDEPQPRKISAAENRDLIFLLDEKGATIQRLRALELISAPTSTPAASLPATSTWKVLFSKTIVRSDTLEAVRDKLKTPEGKPFSPEEKVKLALAKNPLEQKKAGELEVSVAFDKDGSFLRAGDGLPLKRLTDTAHLKWAAVARGWEPDSLMLFQSDGAVVEEFKVTRLSKMMAFDCGEFDYDPARDK
ncbi:MAG: hypothetical protein QOD99_3067 [Chthoniobacter sp.]|jgi:hypothetical protein|nr:hypothetical protein [Chthoniobacter sp.]